MELTTPPKVKQGDRVYIISPSAGLLPFTEIRMKRGIAVLENLGLEVRFGDNAKNNKGYVSGTAQERIDDIHQAFSDTKCSLIIASIGGNHSNQLLELLDYDLISKNPKIFLGYSDLTVLHYAFMTQAHLKTYYGPCFLNQICEYPTILEYTKTSLLEQLFTIDNSGIASSLKASDTYTDEVLDWFTNEDATRPRRMKKNKGFEVWREGRGSGWAMPFTIPSINHVLNTKYLPLSKSAIAIIDIPEGNDMHSGLSISDLDSYITDINNCGLLKNLSGLIVGRAYKYSAKELLEAKSIIMRAVSSYDYPVIYGIDVGHTDPMLTLPIGAQLQIIARKSNVDITLAE